MNVSRQTRSAGGGEGESRRPIGYWAEFNNWWRTRLSEDGCRPSQVELAQWFEANAPLCWRPNEMPSLQEVRTHAKCLRSTEQVRNYFRKYRAARKASSASVRASGSDSDSDGAAPTESISRSISALQSSRVLAAGGASKLLESGISSQPPRAAGAVTTGGGDTRGILPFVFGSNGGAGIFLTSAGGALAGLGALQAAAAGSAAVAAASASFATAGGGSSPRSTKTNAKPCGGPVAFPGQQQQPQDNSGRYVFAGGPVGTLRQTAPASSAAVASRPPAPLPPVAAAVSGPVISFSSGGQPQHSVHGPGPALSIGGGIVLRLPTLQRTASTGGGTSGGGSAARPRGSTPTKHSSPAPPAPAAKRQAIAQPACSSGQTSSVHLGEFGGAYPARYACAPTVSGASSLGRQTAGAGTAAATAGAVATCVPPTITCVPPTITSGMRDSRSFSAVNGAAGAAAGFPASANLSGSMGAGYVSAPSSCPTSAQHPAFHTSGSASATAQHAFDLATLATYPAHHAMHQMQTVPPPNAGPLTAASESTGAGASLAGGVGTAGEPMMVLLSSPGSSPEATEEIACDAAALSPTQAFFHVWEQNEMDDLLVDLPGDADGGADQIGSQARQEIASVAAAIAAATAAAADSMTLTIEATATDVAAAAVISGGTDATTQAVTGLTPVNGSTAAAATAVVVQGKTAGDAGTGGGGDGGISSMDFFTEDAACGAAYGCGAGPGSQAPTAPAHSQPPMSANSQPLASAEYHPLTASLPAVTMTVAALPQTTNVPAHSSDQPQRQPAHQSHHFPRQQATSHDQQSLPGQGPGKAGMDAALRWWPDPNGGVGSGLPPIRTTLQADHVTCSKSQRTNDLPRHHHHQQLTTPTSSQHGGRGGEAVLHVPAMGGGAAVAAGCLGVAPEGGEGLSPASAHELFSILELPQLQVPVPVSKASGRQQQPQQQSQSQVSVQPTMSQQQSQHNNLQGAAPMTSEPSSQPEGGAARGGTYPPMPYPQAWAALPYHGAPDAAAAAMGAPLPGMSHGPNAPAAAAAGPYQPSMCMPYPYGNAGPHYPPYGYCPPPPYGLPPHHPYYYHQMPAPPPPSGSGYDMYGWSPYHLPPHAIPYPGMPYHAYPMGPMMPPPPHQLTHGSTADCPSSAVGAMGSGHLEASSTRFRTTRQGPAPSGGGSGGGASSFIPPAPTAAEPLMPGRYVWQATGGGGLSKLRRAVSAQAVTEGGECNTSGGSAGVGGGATAAAGGNDAVSTMQSRIVPATSAARKRAVPQGSYCSNLNQSYSQSIGVARTKAVTVATADDAATCGGGGGGEAEECVESRNPTTTGGNTSGGREHPAASDPALGGAAAEQLMPPPPPRQPRSEKAAQASAHAILTVENSHLSSGHTTAPALPPGLSSLPLPLPLPMGLHQPSLPTPTFTPAESLYHTAPTERNPPGIAPDTSLPAPVLLPISSEAAAVTPPPAPRPPTCSDSTHERTAASVPVPPPPRGTMQLARAQQQQQSQDIAAVAASTAAVEQSAAAATAAGLGSGDDGDRQEAIDEVGVYVCDDSDLLDLSNITAGLFSPPGSQTTRAPGTSRATGSREIVTSTATASAAATAATFAGGVGAGAAPPPSLDATPNTAAATAAAAATFAFTPVSACTISRSNAFAAPPRPATAVGTTALPTAATAAGAPHSIDPSSHQKCPASARSTDVFRALATPRTLCGSPLDCSVLASWLTSPAGMTSLDACTRPLGLLLGHLDEEGDVSVGGENRMHEGSQALDQVQEHTTEKSLESLEGPSGVATAAAATDGATVAAAELNNVISAGSGSGVVTARPAAAAGDNGAAAGVDEDLGEDLLRTPVPASGRSGTATAVANPADSAARATTAAAPDLTAHIRITFVPSRPPGSSEATPPRGKALNNDGGIIWHHHDHEQQQEGPCTLATKKGVGGGGGDGQADAGDSMPVDGAADVVVVAAEADVNSPLPTLESSLAL